MNWHRVKLIEDHKIGSLDFKIDKESISKISVLDLLVTEEGTYKIIALKDRADKSFSSILATIVKGLDMDIKAGTEVQVIHYDNAWDE